MVDSMVDVSRAAPLMSGSPLYEQYFQGLSVRRIIVPRCDDCEVVQWPPREICGTCQGSSFIPAEMPHEGVVYTYSVMYRAFHPAFSNSVPYGVAVVELTEGVRIIGRFVDSDADSLECGQGMEAVFDDLGNGSGSIAWRRIH
ncbi:Zn-ribbon domain-containing OB-fold protein [Rhodococcus sp. MSC1_016]|uniref:Zn-ribbon domain-containing OB-fold protein n=1 Tax=Rhodococcus sp. MSC1_016 TaxID=2909266 RepID=UPI0020302ABC|nr:OB-fold domain-containing protein [Rhodococcus sp. MSC1_016]